MSAPDLNIYMDPSCIWDSIRVVPDSHTQTHEAILDGVRALVHQTQHCLL